VETFTNKKATKITLTGPHESNKSDSLLAWRTLRLALEPFAFQNLQPFDNIRHAFLFSTLKKHK